MIPFAFMLRPYFCDSKRLCDFLLSFCTIITLCVTGSLIRVTRVIVSTIYLLFKRCKTWNSIAKTHKQSKIIRFCYNEHLIVQSVTFIKCFARIWRWRSRRDSKNSQKVVGEFECTRVTFVPNKLSFEVSDRFGKQ